ncbi:hypothetical protein J6590_033872 [Homalodisca vitripennis]|nr:hypothetical protein J6590_033872 [Homalodisca vitripennis]
MVVSDCTTTWWLIWLSHYARQLENRFHYLRVHNNLAIEMVALKYSSWCRMRSSVSALQKACSPWLLLGWVAAKRSCPCKQPACPVIGCGSEVTFKRLEGELELNSTFTLTGFQTFAIVMVTKGMTQRFEDWNLSSSSGGGGISTYTNKGQKEVKKGKEKGSNVPKKCLESSPGVVTAGMHDPFLDSRVDSPPVASVVSAWTHCPPCRNVALATLEVVIFISPNQKQRGRQCRSLADTAGATTYIVRTRIRSQSAVRYDECN